MPRPESLTATVWSCDTLLGAMMRLLIAVALILPSANALAQQAPSRLVSGVVLTVRHEAVPGALIMARTSQGRASTMSDEGGAFRLVVPAGEVQLEVSGKNLRTEMRSLGATEVSQGLRIQVVYSIPPRHESMVITASALDPSIERRNGVLYEKSLFSRDDQLFETLDAGINAGQHEGGGKSLEIRRFGFNLDHGGVGGGLKVLVDDVQQNQATQAHGQGYLGQLKSLSPELVEEVEILNGPFSVEYGDFSGLGVVHIRQRESLPDLVTLRMQGGSFGSLRGFAGYSPRLRDADAFVAYEGSYTDGPFENPLRYQRHNVNGNYTWHFRENQAIGAKFNFGKNDFFSSGQLPLDEVAAGRLNRFGSVDPFDGGRIRLGTFAAYYRRDFTSGGILKLDGFLARSLFDLFSNFTFFLNDPVNGDEIQQHDSRLQQGLNAQYLRPNKLFGEHALLTLGSNFHDNQINVGLLHTAERQFLGNTTSAHAHVTNAAWYAQQGIDFARQRLHVDFGLRYDEFRFAVDDRLVPSQSGIERAGRLQPKANLAYTPFARLPFTFHASYGRGISSQDARGVVQRPLGERLATTDFYQVGTSHNLRRAGFSADVFFIDRSNEQVYIPDDGSFELRGPSRVYGFELKNSLQVTRSLSFNAGLTRVSNAFYRGTLPRLYVDSAPHTVANTALTLNGWHDFSGSLRYRHIDGYRLDGSDPTIQALGFDLLDLNLTRELGHGSEFNFGVDNLTNKHYFETQNFFASRLRPQDRVIERIHATPGFSRAFTLGLSVRLGEH